jgi:hypothetical protein
MTDTKLAAAIQSILRDMNDPLNVNMQTLYWAARIEALALEQQSAAHVPGGMVLVPREPTEAMVEAGETSWDEDDPSPKSTYRAMIAAAQ